MARMVVIAGPPGSGKSTGFPASETGLESFNADDRAAALNGGSYLNLTEEIRAKANRELEHFVSEHIQSATSFAFETTLRTDVTVQQARLARRRGFSTLMMYVGVDDAEECIRRVQIRAQAGAIALLRMFFAISTVPAYRTLQRRSVPSMRLFSL